MEQVALTLGINIDKKAFDEKCDKLINQIYKLLPMREEHLGWRKPLQTLIVQMAGMKQLVNGQDELLFTILCKMKGLLILNNEEDMMLYRRTILELLGLVSSLKTNVNVI